MKRHECTVHSIVLVLLACGLMLPETMLAEDVSLTPDMLIDNSIAYHDPNGAWGASRIHMRIDTEYSKEYAVRAGNTEVKLSLTLAPHAGEFLYIKETGNDKVEIAVRQEVGSLRVNGSAEVPKAEIERLKIREPQMYRDYCEYLYGMPMKLRDKGTIVDPQLQSSQFQGQDVLQLKATYDPEVGSDLWYFYFHPTTFALLGYRFYHDEAKNDGEFISFAGEIVDDASGLRIPKARAWYFNADGKHLATDHITTMTVAPIR